MLGAARDTELSMSNQPAERVPIALSGANPTGIAAAKQTATSDWLMEPGSKPAVQHNA
jgi:hypothetical protein